MTQPNKQDRSLGELFGELAKETSTLVRQEVELAKTEMTNKVTKVGKDIGSLAVGGAVAYAGFLVLLAAIVLLIGQYIPVWLAALVVGLVVAGIGYFLVQKGLTDLKTRNFAPTQTMETLKEDAEWAKRQTQ